MSLSDELAVTQGKDVTADRTETADVCVIGSGCGGASLANRLAAQGKSVVVVERGGFYSAKDFDQREVHMLAKIDGARGLDTSDDGGASFTYGNNVGGASVHYWADSYRTPPDRLKLWAERFGIEGHDEETLRPSFDEIERDLNVHEADDAHVNTMNRLVHDAATALGWAVERVPQARRGCPGSGHCMQGCAYDAKQSQLVTYIPAALSRGAKLFSDARAVELVSDAPGVQGTVRALRCRIVDRASGRDAGPTLTVKAKAFVVAAGGYGTPEFLLRQRGLKDRLPHLGEHFFCNPCAQVHGVFPEEIVQWRNIPAAWGVTHFRLAREQAGAYVEGGYLLMANQLHPAVLSACLLVDGKRQREIMLRYRNLGGAIAWIDDAEEGRVWIDGAADTGRRRVHVPLGGGNGLRLKDAWSKGARMLFEAGATEVFFGDVNDTRMRDVAAVGAAVASLDIRPSRNVFATPHPGGGARMGRDASTSVVGFDHRVHGTDNLYVSDPSVFPTPPSVDPSLSIMAFSFVAAAAVAARV